MSVCMRDRLLCGAGWVGGWVRGGKGRGRKGRTQYICAFTLSYSNSFSVLGQGLGVDEGRYIKLERGE